MQKTSHRSYKSPPILSHTFRDHKAKNMPEAILVATTSAPVNTGLTPDCVAMSVPNPVFPVVILPYHHPPLMHWPSHCPPVWPGLPPPSYPSFHPQTAYNSYLPQSTEGISQAIDNLCAVRGLDDNAWDSLRKLMLNGALQP